MFAVPVNSEQKALRPIRHFDFAQCKLNSLKTGSLTTGRSGPKALCARNDGDTNRENSDERSRRSILWLRYSAFAKAPADRLRLYVLREI